MSILVQSYAVQNRGMKKTVTAQRRGTNVVKGLLGACLMTCVLAAAPSSKLSPELLGKASEEDVDVIVKLRAGAPDDSHARVAATAVDKRHNLPLRNAM